MTELQRRRRGLMGQQKSGGGLPSEYQQVEWVGVEANTSNTGYETGIDMGNVSRIEMRLAVVTANTSEYIVIATSDPARFNYPYGSLSGGSGGWYQCSPTLQAGAVAPSTDYTLTRSGTADQKIVALLGYNRSSYVAGTEMSWVKIYGANDELLFDGIPAYEKSSGNIGLYDAVSSTFINGRGSYRTKGADV